METFALGERVGKTREPLMPVVGDLEQVNHHICCLQIY